MSLSQDFIQAVTEKDTLSVRIMLKDSLVVDPTFLELQQLLSYAEQHLTDLYDPHDGEVLESIKAKYDKEYMDSQMVKIVRNFSEERLALLKDVCKHLFKERAQEIEQERNASKKSFENNAQKVGTGLTVGGLAIAVIGVAISKPLIIITGAAIAIAGGAVILANHMGVD